MKFNKSSFKKTDNTVFFLLLFGDIDLWTECMMLFALDGTLVLKICF